jgi:hypothetical protein
MNRIVFASLFVIFLILNNNKFTNGAAHKSIDEENIKIYGLLERMVDAAVDERFRQEYQTRGLTRGKIFRFRNSNSYSSYYSSSSSYCSLF